VPPFSPSPHYLLARRLPVLQLDAVSLKDTLDFLRDINSMDLAPRWGRLRAVGIYRITPVSIRLRDVTVAEALDAILAGLNRNLVVGPRLAYVLDEHSLVIMISSR
jgi:hypothetical protein